jgi:hypothetical protein
MKILVLMELHRGTSTLPDGQLVGGESEDEERVFQFDDEELR